jgi:23S rRNA pseudouridine1911/1915/1917 synthase
MPLVTKTFEIPEKSHVMIFIKNVLNISLGDAQRLIDRDKVYLNGKIFKNKKLKSAGTLEVVVFESSGCENLIKPLHMTEYFAIFDKPPFLLSHPKDRTSNLSVLDSIRHFLGDRAGLAHRLDFETSGLILAYRDKKYEADIKALFEKREVQKTYIAVVKGRLEKEQVIDAPILPNHDFSLTKDRAFITKKGKSATTHVRPLEVYENHTIIEARPKEGRLHQIRLHLHHIGHTILGEPIYGRSFELASRYLDKELSDSERIELTGASRVMLNSQKIEFSFKGEEFSFESRRKLEL